MGPLAKKKRSRPPVEWESLYRVGRPAWDTGRPSAELVRAVESGLIRPMPALELGCGTGANAIWLSRRRFEVTAVDCAGLAIERARARCEEQNGLVRFIQADIFEFAPTAGRFPLVVDVGFYHFVRIADLERFLDALWWVTEPGSLYFMLAGRADGASDDGPPRVTEDDIRNELGRLFEVVQLDPCRLDTSRRGETHPGWVCLLRRPPVK